MKKVNKNFDSDKICKGIEVESKHKNTYIKLFNYHKVHGLLPPIKLFYIWLVLDNLEKDNKYYNKLKDFEEQLRSQEDV